MNQSGAQELVLKHGSMRAAARAAEMSPSTFWGILHGRTKIPRGTIRKEPVVMVHRDVKGNSMADFRSTYDKSFIVPKKIKEALARLGSQWLYEMQFAKMAGVSLSDLGSFRDQFATFVVTLDRQSRRAWAGTEAFAQQMRKVL